MLRGTRQLRHILYAGVRKQLHSFLDRASKNVGRHQTSIISFSLPALTESTIFTTLAEDPLVSVETVRVETTADNNYYNLMGQKVTGNLPAGIYIHNGKKIIVR